jgi:hypothetical protein
MVAHGRRTYVARAEWTTWNSKSLLTMGDIAPKVFANNNMPCSPISLIKLFLDLCSNILLDAVFFECRRRDIDALLLHFVAHVYILYDSFWWTAPIPIPWDGASVG